MNILAIGYWLPPEKRGGASRYLWESAEELAKRGNVIHVIAYTENEGLPEYEVINGVNIHRFFVKTKNPLVRYIYRTKGIGEIYKKIAKKINFDIINIYGSGRLHRLFPSIKNIPLVYTFHASLPHELKFDFTKQISQKVNLWQILKICLRFPFYYYRYKWTENKVLKKASAIITMSDFVRKEILRFYGRKYISKIKVIPIGVYTEKFIPVNDKMKVRRSLGLPEDTMTFFTTRRLKLRMGLENLIVATSKVVKQHPDILVLIGGRGPLYERLNGLVKKLNLQNNIRLLGFIEEVLLPRYYQSADAFVLPTEQLEGFGIVTIEALSSNLPVLGTPAGATPEILRQINTNLIARDTSPDTIADTMLYFIDNFKLLTNSDVYRKLVLEKYDWEIIGERIERVYRRCLRTKIER